MFFVLFFGCFFLVLFLFLFFWFFSSFFVTFFVVVVVMLLSELSEVYLFSLNLQIDFPPSTGHTMLKCFIVSLSYFF